MLKQKTETEAAVELSNSDVDPVTLEVLKNALCAIADEMALVILRSSYSPIVRDNMDFSTGLADRDGRIVALGLTLPLHVGSFPSAMQAFTSEFANEIRAGDIFVWNDPYGYGGMHLPDVYIVKPIFFDGALEGYAITLAHQCDLGGIAYGGNSVEAWEIYQEGLRIPAVRLYQAGEPNDSLFRLIKKNSRVPDKVMGDMRAQVAACHHADRSVMGVVKRYGAHAFRTYLSELHRHAEQLMRAEIRELPDGQYEFTDYIDGLGEDPEDIVFKSKVTISGDEITVDWTGTSPQVKGAINAPVAFTYAAAYVAVRCIVDRDIPYCEGFMKPIKVIAPVGTIVNAQLPAACGARAITGFRMIDCLLGALSKAVPNRVPAAGEGGPAFHTIGGWRNGRAWIVADALVGSRGANCDHDGVSGLNHPGANLSNQPIEVIEAEYPLEIIRYGLVPNSGGPGKNRGALAIEKAYRLLAENAELTVRSDRRKHPPFGLFEGKPGAPSWNFINPGPNQRVLPQSSMKRLFLEKDDVFLHIGAGGGGYGSPLLRDPQRVLKDVIEEKETIDFVRSVYGVVIDPKTIAVDEKATAKVRSQMQDQPLSHERQSSSA